MLKHVVMLAFRERAEGRGKFENASVIRDRFLTLKNETNGFLKMEVNIGDQITKDNYDLIIVTSHRDRSALTQYLNNPKFVDIRNQYQPLIESSAVIDYQETTLGD